MPSERQPASPEQPTYHEPTFRTWPPKRLMGPGGKPLMVKVCEELDPESGRWEPFVSIRPVPEDRDLSARRRNRSRSST
jgi:hypothetical protein